MTGNFGNDGYFYVICVLQHCVMLLPRNAVKLVREPS